MMLVFRARTACRGLAATLVLAGSGPVAAATVEETRTGLSIEVRAREIAPGEPLRLLVTSDVPLASLRGQFLSEEVFLLRDGRADDGRSWSGWTMVGLDQEPGPASIDLTGVLADGTPVPGTLAVTIRAKPFPEERLTVESKYVEPSPEAQERLEREREKLARVYGTRRELPPAGAAFSRPVAGEPTAIFGTRRLYNGQPRSPHPGLDLRAGTGTPVRASGDGVVGLAQDLYYSGLTVIVDHGGGLFTIYAHLSRIDVEEGQAVSAGQFVGQSGATGRVTGPHLHWGAKIGDRPFDPAALLDPVLFE